MTLHSHSGASFISSRPALQLPLEKNGSSKTAEYRRGVMGMGVFLRERQAK
jgi:hypothetical protein